MGALSNGTTPDVSSRLEAGEIRKTYFRRLAGNRSVTSLEICAVSKVSKKEIGRVFKLILKTLETSVELITTGDFMSRFCTSLGLATTIQKAATHIARRAVELDLVPGRSPISVAASAIYMASQALNEKKDRKSQKEIGDIAGVAEVTIKQSYKLMYGRAHELFPSDCIFVTPIEQLPIA